MVMERKMREAELAAHRLAMQQQQKQQQQQAQQVHIDLSIHRYI